METLRQDLVYAFRMMRSRPAFTVVAVLALALGIGANSAIFTVVDSILLKPLPYKDPDRLVTVTRGFRDGFSESISDTKILYWKEHNHSFEEFGVHDNLPSGCNLVGGDTPERVPCIRASAGFFRALGMEPSVGRNFTAKEEQIGAERVVILSNGLWKRRFGSDPSMVGRTINISGEPHTVIGITPEQFQWPTKVDVWLPFRAKASATDRANIAGVLAKLKPGVSVESARADCAAVFAAFLRDNPQLKEGNTEWIRVAPLQEDTVGNTRVALYVLAGAVGFVLLIACANVANLLLARAAERQKEVAVRTALGAARWRIVRQMLTESVVLSSLGAIVGLLIAYASIQALIAASPGNLPRVAEIHLDWRVVLFTGLLSLVTGILFGLAPAWQITKPDVYETLKEGGRSVSGGLHSQRLRKLLVVSEVALALVLVTGAALLIESFRNLRNVDPGFDARNVLTMKTSLSLARYGDTMRSSNFYRQVLQRIETLPGVQSAAVVMSLPMEPGPDLPFEVEGRADNTGGAQYRFATPHFFQALSIPVKQGRSFTESDTGASTPVVIINEALAKKHFKNVNPIGERITIGRVMGPPFLDKTRVIVGVAGNVREQGLGSDVPETVYLPSTQIPDALTALGMKLLPSAWVIQATANPSALMAAVKREVAAVDGEQPISDIRLLEEIVSRDTARERFNLTLLGSMAGLALLLAAIGIYGVISYSVSQRTHEIGIRMALGASAGEMLRLIVRQGVSVAGAGVVVGLIGSAALGRLITSLLFGVKPFDPVIYGVVAAVLLVVALVASWIPARRAMRIDPVIALRYE